MNLSYKKETASPLASLTALTVMILFLVMLVKVLSLSLYEDAIYLDETFTLTYNNQPSQEVKLGTYVFPAIHRGDSVVLRTILPELPFESTHMQLRIWHSTIDVSVDGVPIFSYGAEALAAGKPVGSGYQWIALPQDAGGKELEIKFCVTEDGSFTQFIPPMLYPPADMILDFIRQNSTMTAIGLFLFALGLILLLFTSILLLFRRDAIELFWIALLALDIGLWVLCRYGIFQLVSSNAQLNYYLEYISLYLTPPLALLCIYAIQEERQKHSLLTTLFIGTTLLYVPVLLILHWLGILYLSESLRICHLFILATCLFIFCYCFRRRHDTAARIKLFGVIVLTVLSVFDLLLFMLENFVPTGHESTRYSLAAIGAILFIFILLINYGLTSVQHLYIQAETAALKKQVYTDSLTGIYNRTKANEIMQSLDLFPERSCGMLLFDINNLKETNDQFGHDAGDKLICTFSAILSENFQSLGTVARIGGDEFIVLLLTPDKESVTENLTNMLAQMKTYNANNSVFQVYAAYGCAYSSELTDWTAEKLYRLADQKMYACKAMMKEKAGDISP